LDHLYLLDLEQSKNTEKQKDGVVMSGESFWVSGGEKQKKVGLVYMCVYAGNREREYCRMWVGIEAYDGIEMN